MKYGFQFVILKFEGATLRRLLLFALGLSFMLVVTGCASFAPPKRAATPVVMPSVYSMYFVGEAQATDWWKNFGSDELNRLIAEALANNTDLRAAWARLKQANAAAVQAGAKMLPNVDASGSAQNQKKRTETKDTNPKTTETNTYSLGLAASYELDVWGKLSAGSESAQLSALAGRDDAEALAMSIAAGVAENWVQILAVREEMRKLTQQIELNTTFLKLLELRFAKSLATGLAVSQQREVLARAQAEMPLLKVKEWNFLNALAILTGRTVSEVAVLDTELPAPVPLPQAGLPADLLAARPDVRAAGLRLQSADWQVSVARANRLPSLSLSASGMLQSASVDFLFTNWVTTLTAGITGPIFDGGYRKAEVERTRAVAEERVAQYAGVVLTAIAEVEKGLGAEKYQQEYLNRLGHQWEATQVALDEARLRYLMGQSDFLPLLTELLSAQQLERTLIVERANLMTYRISLYRALGGDWTRQLTQSGLPVASGEDVLGEYPLHQSQMSRVLPAHIASNNRMESE